MERKYVRDFAERYFCVSRACTIGPRAVAQESNRPELLNHVDFLNIERTNSRLDQKKQPLLWDYGWCRGSVDALWTVLSRLSPPSHNPTSFAGRDSSKLPKVKSFFYCWQSYDIGNT